MMMMKMIPKQVKICLRCKCELSALFNSCHTQFLNFKPSGPHYIFLSFSLYLSHSPHPHSPVHHPQNPARAKSTKTFSRRNHAFSDNSRAEVDRKNR